MPTLVADRRVDGESGEQRPRILLEEAIAKSAGNKDASDKGPGGESGPYQTMHVPHGWVTDPEERERVRAPEDACTQYVGDKQPAVLSMTGAA